MINKFTTISLVGVWKKKKIENKIHLKIEKSKINKDTFDVKFELNNLKNDSSNVRADKSKYGSKFSESKFGGKLHEVSGCRNTRPKFLHGQYSAIKVKARNFLTNISHKRLLKKDLISKSFITDCFAFILIYLNPFSLEKKFENINIVFYQKFFERLLTNGIF